MIELDLTEAVEAAARARWKRTSLATKRSWELLPAPMQASVRRATSADDIAAAAPIIAAQVAEQIAAAIELTGRKAHASAIRRPCRTGAEYATDLADDFEWAAMVAREAVR